MDKTQQITIQAKAFDFALHELVLCHRESFQPLWTVDSWAKFLIWMALNCGLSGDKQSLQLFADSLGPALTSRIRRIFFERTMENFSVCVMADPAEKNVLIIPLEDKVEISFSEATKALESIAITDFINRDQSQWRVNDGLISIPWLSSESKR
ncbi:protein phosphatase [Prochlorococcus sp. MIT 1223]|uniref:protein phosphatase n=1 Tax=Prochlorococcus sp. MIT 1223 TaxID=3096217 RepID=UPI002A74A3E0|nr:protein phosphatase [Prochlorococcus sp. MIT 1223]